MTSQLFWVGFACLVALVVFAGLLYANFGFLSLAGYFEKQDIYKDSIILFFHDECPYCAQVDAYLKSNNAAQKVEFVKLNVLENEYNRNELADKAQVCGLDIDKIGVPFLWDGPEKKCVIGYVDIINFFRQKLKKP